MQQHTRTKDSLYRYLKDQRLLSDSVIEESGFFLTENKNYIGIPIKNKQGEVIFNKYRKFNSDHTGPKYRYDKGASNALYGVHLLDDEKGVVFLCEGEFDSLIIRSKLGLPAVSLTGGAGSFSEDMVSSLKNKTVVICYDYDEAGIVGAFKMFQTLTSYDIEARFVWIEQSHMDATDFIKEFGATDFIKLIVMFEENDAPFNSGATLPVPRKEIEFDNDSSKKEVKEHIRLVNATLDSLLGFERFLSSNKRLYTHVSALKSIWKKRKEAYTRIVKRKSYKTKEMSGKINVSDIEKAKVVPIDRFISFNSQHKATSLWKKYEKTPSMHYYKEDNRVHCFATGTSADVIDVVMVLHPSLDFVSAVNFILNYE